MTSSPNSRSLQRALDAGTQASGVWCSIGSAHVTELIVSAGPDFVVIDRQHGLISNSDMLAMLRAVTRSDVSPLVRVAANDAAAIGAALDAGADGVIVPMIHDAAGARAAVAACRYPPDGVRSYGPARSSFVVPGTPDKVNRSVVCVLLVESRRGIEDAEEILAVPGVDAVMIGTADLALDLGVELGGKSADLDVAVSTVIAEANRVGVAVMIGAPDLVRLEDSARPRRLLLLAGSDVAALRQGLRTQLRNLDGTTY